MSAMPLELAALTIRVFGPELNFVLAHPFRYKCGEVAYGVQTVTLNHLRTKLQTAQLLFGASGTDLSPRQDSGSGATTVN